MHAESDLDRGFILSAEPLCVVGGDGYLKQVNPAFEQALGYTEAELLARPHIDFVYPDDQSAFAAANRSPGAAAAGTEWRYVRKDGAIRWLEWSIRSVREDGALYGAARDVTERKQLEAQQAALRRVATAVARGTADTELFALTVTELNTVGGADMTVLLRFDANDYCTYLAGLGETGYELGAHFHLIGKSVTSEVRRTGQVTRMDYADTSGDVVTQIASFGYAASVGAPVMVDGRVWGVMTSAYKGRPPADTESRVADFTDLVATAIANAHSHSELLASRIRIVAAADDARRRIERDLHDGAQQRLVEMTMRLRAVIDEFPAGSHKTDLEGIASGLEAVLDDLRETARGVHPVILSRGGLGPAVKALARRSQVPVTPDVRVPKRLPEPLEVAAYYVVAETLTNAAKHSRATAVTVDVKADDDRLSISIRDDGVGGADLSHGSGLIGLTDRVVALGGTFDLHSPSGDGTAVCIELPLQVESADDA